MAKKVKKDPVSIPDKPTARPRGHRKVSASRKSETKQESQPQTPVERVEKLIAPVTPDSEQQVKVGPVAKSIWAIVTLLAFVALVFAIDYYQNQNRVDTVPTPRALDTSSWEVYSNDIYGFTFKMPQEWGQYNVTKASRTENKNTGLEFTYNYFHFEYPKRIDDEASGNVFFEIGIFSSTAWQRARNEWKLLGSNGGIFFGGRSSEENIAAGLEDRWAEINTIFSTFTLANSSPVVPTNTNTADSPESPQLE